MKITLLEHMEKVFFFFLLFYFCSHPLLLIKFLMALHRSLFCFFLLNHSLPGCWGGSPVRQHLVRTALFYLMFSLFAPAVCYMRRLTYLIVKLVYEASRKAENLIVFFGVEKHKTECDKFS